MFVPVSLPQNSRTGIILYRALQTEGLLVTVSRTTAYSAGTAISTEVFDNSEITRGELTAVRMVHKEFIVDEWKALAKKKQFQGSYHCGGVVRIYPRTRSFAWDKDCEFQRKPRIGCIWSLYPTLLRTGSSKPCVVLRLGVANPMAWTPIEEPTSFEHETSFGTCTSLKEVRSTRK